MTSPADRAAQATSDPTAEPAAADALSAAPGSPPLGLADPMACPSVAAAVADATPGPGVATALSELANLQGQPVEQHVEVYERAHRSLQDAMADADEA